MLSRRSMLAGVSAGALLPLAGCASLPITTTGGETRVIQDIATIATYVQTGIGGFCSALPTFDTIASIVLAIVGGAAGVPASDAAMKAIADQVAKAICDRVAAVEKSGRAPGRHRKAVRIHAGQPPVVATVLDYGPITINGKIVRVEVLGQ